MSADILVLPDEAAHLRVSIESDRTRVTVCDSESQSLKEHIVLRGGEE